MQAAYQQEPQAALAGQAATEALSVALGELEAEPVARPTTRCAVESGLFRAGQRIRVSGEGFGEGARVKLELLPAESDRATTSRAVVADHSGGMDRLIDVPTTARVGWAHAIAKGESAEGGELVLVEPVLVTDSCSSQPSMEGP